MNIIRALKYNNLSSSIYRAASFLILSALVMFLDASVIKPLLERNNLLTMVQRFNYLLPEKLLSSVFIRYISFIWGILVIIFFLKYINNYNLKNSFLFPQKDRIVCYGKGWLLCLGLLIMPIIFGLIKVNGIDMDPLKIIPMLLLNVAIQIPTGFLEEAQFRGYIFQTLNLAINPHLSVIISALVFGLLHFSTYSYSVVLFSFIFGIVSAYMVIIYKNIYFAAGLHSCMHIMGNRMWDIFDMDAMINPIWINNAMLLMFLGFLFIRHKLWKLTLETNTEKLVVKN